MNVYDFNVVNAYGEKVSLEEYKNKVLLIINSATQCGFTPQYDELQDMYEKYGDQGFVILDFPCNQFGNQAPGTNAEIVKFCDSRYGITFPIFSKIDVNGENAAPLYQYLVKEQGFKGLDKDHPLTPTLESMLERLKPNFRNEPDIKWNFTKFLVDRKGNVVERFEPTAHMADIEAKVNELL
jgi:Glutathione peroxidase